MKFCLLLANCTLISQCKNTIQMKKCLLFFIVLSWAQLILAQTNAPLNHSYFSYIEKEMHAIGVSEHTSIKPHLLSSYDTSFYNSFKPIFPKNNLLNKFFNNDLFSVNTEEYSFSLNPLFHFELAKDNKNRYVNTRGVEVKGRLGQKVNFYSSFYENQLFLPDYIQHYVKTHDNVVPGQGLAKSDISLNKVMDFYYAMAYVDYQANQFFNFQFGHGKHFIGDGYRSMLLSDNSFNYPYFKITTDVWKFKYVNLFSYFQDIDFDIDADDISKYKFNATHYLSINIGQRLTLGLFESIMLGEDSLGNVFDVNYMNPIIFYRPVEYSVGYSRQGNALLGLGFKYKLSSQSHLYGQFILDEFRLSEIKSNNGGWRNKYGGQIGIKYFDIFGIKNLRVQSELNFARPFTYSHFNPIQNYSHYAQPLAHPLGTSFIENVIIARYRKNRWTADLKLIHAKHGGEIASDSINYGSDIFISYKEGNPKEFGNAIAQGNTTNLQIIDFRLGYIINPRTNMKLELGITNRLSNDLNSTSTNRYLFFAYKTDLSNFYYDF